MAGKTVKTFVDLHGWMAVVVENAVSHTVVFDGEAIVFRGLTGCHLRFDLSEKQLQFSSCRRSVLGCPAVCPITQAGRRDAALCSDHASRRHDTGQLYVNAPVSFSSAECYIFIKRRLVIGPFSKR